MTAQLEVRNLTKRFGGLTAVNNVSFTLNKGEILGFIGPNGAGKTTVVGLISGSIYPSSGEVYFKGAHRHRADVQARSYGNWPHLSDHEAFSGPVRTG
ncbi:hypothetical protein C048_02855 [Brucella melitensis UK19/04]|nr:branched-chain amino acid ABC transporter ATP-binding protein [Brucella melitensis]ENQ95387.1 hypothetical protein C048_02855 [Brucella melitensis UK19/04]ENS55730.1 hypothetical protein C036_02169 [Brucella melitensis F1/06 B10]ENS68561.1 hypothetical protein C034_02578 [Brucella melitensis UK14/06]ENS72516.1 hypothetical protein C060_02196 [Brucella melitensis UK22/04]ENS73636.1 hypothetical protein C059_02847 [Brucella melitensis UK23/06]ENS78380.1 hypothetical protein C047_02856 [Bruce